MMKKVFILLVLGMNVVCFNHAVAKPFAGQNVIFNDDGQKDNSKESGGKKEKGGKKNPEEDCE